jgi:hypothetical protein
MGRVELSGASHYINITYHVGSLKEEAGFYFVSKSNSPSAFIEVKLIL